MSDIMFQSFKVAITSPRVESGRALRCDHGITAGPDCPELMFYSMFKNVHIGEAISELRVECYGARYVVVHAHNCGTGHYP